MGGIDCATVEHPERETGIKEFDVYSAHDRRLDHRAFEETVGTFPHVLLLCVLYVVHLHRVFAAAVTGASSVDQALHTKRVQDLYRGLNHMVLHLVPSSAFT